MEGSMQPPEIQGITTTTNIEAIGLVYNYETLAWVISNQAGVETADPIAATWPILPAEVMYQTTYNDLLNVDDGYTLFNKQVDSISTANQVLDGKNIKMEQTLKYDALDTAGTATLTEQITIDGTGNESITANNFMCVFATAKSSTVPKYCNFATAGSSSTITSGSLATTASDSFIGASMDYPVTLSYAITGKPIAGELALFGKVTSNAKVVIAEARNGTSQAESLQWSDKMIASGTVSSVTKTYNYWSGFRAIAVGA